MSEAGLLQHYITLGTLLFALGLAGFLVRRNVIVMFLSVELMLQGVSLSLIGWGRFHDHWGGQALVTFIIAVAACEAGIALVLVLMLCQYARTLDVVEWQAMREETASAYRDREVPEEPPDPSVHEWPRLTPAGVRPAVDPGKEAVRPHV